MSLENFPDRKYRIHRSISMPILSCAAMEDINLRLQRLFSIVVGEAKCGAMVAAATAVFAGICIGFAYSKRSRARKNEARDVFSRSMSFGAIHGGRLALERVIDYHRARADAATLDAAETELKNLITDEHPNFKKLQSTIAKLEMSGKEAEAVAILETELKRAKKRGKSHEAYEIGMLLVEMYIYKGDFSKALKCDCLRHKEISDARRPLYQAIVHIMLDQPRRSKEFWEEFKDIRIRFQSPPSPKQTQINKAITSFNEFEKIVKVLKRDIEMAHTETKTM